MTRGLFTQRQWPKPGSVWTFQRNGYDRLFSHATVTEGQRVRVVNLPGAPKAGVMGQCHVVDAASGELLGMVDIRSLQHVKTDADEREERAKSDAK
jgi:hypothetical protein